MDELKVVPGDSAYIVDYDMLKVKCLKVNKVEITKDKEIFISFDKMPKAYLSDLVYTTEIEAFRQLKIFKETLKFKNGLNLEKN